jgi:phosphomevalonate kinase
VTTERTLSAPGKLFLAGEYAVLWGGVARLVAVEPRARVLVRGHDDRRVELVFSDGRVSGQATPAGVRWDEAVPEKARFAAVAVDLALRVVGRDGPGFAVAFEPSPLVDGHKLGLGSSARAAVLATEAARVVLGASFDSLKLALVAHADAQGGRGSGGDVAASVVGGVLRYQRYEVSKLLEASRRGGLIAALHAAPPVEVLRLGSPVFPFAYGFSGVSASTPGLISAVERDLDAAARARFVTESDALGLELELGLLRGDFPRVREACEGLQRLLAGLAATRSDAVDRLLALARTFGCTGKQSGAGGGDGVIIVAPDDGALAAFLDACAARNLVATPVSPAEGLRGDAARPAELAAWLDAR